MNAAELAAAVDAAKREVWDAVVAHGHDPHPWKAGLRGEAGTACRRCGGRLFVKVTATRVTTNYPRARCTR